jgi:hypothetical protein
MKYWDLLHRKGAGTPFDACEPVSSDALERASAAVGPLPIEYSEFLTRIGAGPVGDAYVLYSGPMSPEEVYGPGAPLAGVVLIGDDFAGVRTGIVVGDGRVVDIDPVTHAPRHAEENFEVFIRAKIWALRDQYPERQPGEESPSEALTEDERRERRMAALAEALETIEQERRSGRFERAYDAVGAVVDAFGENGLADAVYEAASADTPWPRIADLLGFAIWQTKDNGGAIMRTAERWLRDTTDSRKAFVALHLDAYPFLDRAEMEQVLTEAAARFPEAAARCAEVIESRREDAAAQGRLGSNA